MYMSVFLKFKSEIKRAVKVETVMFSFRLKNAAVDESYFVERLLF